jgi:hypothetical protein
MTRTLLRLSALLLIPLLHSCGGGGGGGNNGGGNPPPPPPGSNLVALTAANAETVGILSFGPTDNAYQAMLLLTEAARFLQQQSMVEAQFACTISGTVRLSAADRNTNGSFNAGDSVFITYQACNGSTSGTLRLDITAITYDSGQIVANDGTVTLDLSFPGSSPATLTGTGTLVHRANASELSWLGTGFSVRLAIGTQRESLTNGRIEKVITASPGLRYAVTLSGTIDSDELGGRFTFTTQPAFVGDENLWPESGRLTAAGRNNSTTSFRTFNVTQGVAGFEVDADGNGIIDGPATGIDWDQIANGVVFGMDVDGDLPPPSNPGPNVFGRRIALGAAGGDLEVDNARGRVYVTLPDRNELLVFSAQSLEVVRRFHLPSRPNGLSMSADDQEIFVGLGAAGSVAVIDADTFAVATIFVAPELGSSRVYHVVETSPGVLYAATSIPDTDGRITRIDRTSGVITPIATTGPNFEEIELVADSANGVLYAADGLGDASPVVHKYNATDPLTPLLLAQQSSTPDTAHRMSLDAGRQRLYLSSGQVLATGDFSLVGRISRGTPWASDNGVDVLVATGDGDLTSHSATDLRVVDLLETDCALTRGPGDSLPDVDRLMPSPVDGQWLLLGGDILCAVDLNNPTVPPGTGQPGVQPDPLPVVNVQSTSVLLPGGSSYDAEFDEPRNRLYVSVPSSGEVVTIDAATYQVIERDVLGNRPRGLALSPDGSTLAIVFNQNGNIGFKDLASGQTEMRDLTATLGTTAANDVAWVSDDAIFVSADGGAIVRTSRSDPGATRRSADGANFSSQVELTPSPDGDFLYVRESSNRVLKLDLSLPDEPVVLMYEQLTSGITQPLGRPSVSPDGERISFSDGTVLRTSDFFQAGQIGPLFTTLYSPDGTSLYQALGSTFLDRYDPAIFLATQRLATNCSGSTPTRLHSNAAGNRVIGLSQTHACFWRLDQPTANGMRISPHSAYVCGAACLLRQYHRQSGGRWMWRAPAGAGRTLQPPFMSNGGIINPP